MLTSIKQYLRVTNIEVVGLPTSGEDEVHQEILLEALNTMGLPYDIRPRGTDHSHPIPTRIKDGKNVAVCKFVNKKVKIDIVGKKKLNKSLKSKGNDFYINEHLSQENRRLFAESSKKRKQLNYKYIWTSNGLTHLRKDDGTPVLFIDSDEALDKLKA